jgi:hypothetical protein
MPLDVQNIRTSMSRSAQPGREPRWHDLLRELTAATSAPFTPQVERLLLDILRFEGELQLDESAEMPHSMSPEDMLKSLAAQSLGRLCGAEFLPTLRRLLFTTSPALSCMIRGVIRQVTSGKGNAPQAEAVTAVRSEGLTRTVTFDWWGSPRGGVVERESGGWVYQEAIPVIQHCGMAYVAEPRLAAAATAPGPPAAIVKEFA